MELKIRYDNEYQTVELDAEATEELWISLSLEGEGLSQEEREEMIRDEWEVRFNRPEYNSWHKFGRHWGSSMAQLEEDEDLSGPLMKEVADDSAFRRDEIERDRKEEYEEVCMWVREALSKKPKWADAFIAVRLDGMPVNKYAASISVSDADLISKWLARAEKKMKKIFEKRQI